MMFSRPRPSKILIAAPVRNRAWILKEYLAALRSLDYPRLFLGFFFLINDSTDSSEDIIKEFGEKIIKDSPEILLFKYLHLRYGQEKWWRGQYSFSHLAELRNLILEFFLASPCDYLFSVDSDVIVPPHTLNRLLSDQKDVVAALAPNDLHLRVPTEKQFVKRYYNVLRLVQDRLVHIYPFPQNNIFSVDCTGAACLIARSVIEAGVRYGDHPQGEDAHFCLMAKEKDFTLWADSRVICEHRMLAPET